MGASLATDSEVSISDCRRFFVWSRVAIRLYQGIAEGRCPAGIKLSARAVRWKKSDIDKLVTSLATGKRRTSRRLASARPPLVLRVALCSRASAAFGLFC
jgi:predicted DNA-binding transcriptional regulator AlpA